MQRTAPAAIDPTAFGFVPRRHGWVKPFPGWGDVAFVPLAWPHAQSAAYARGDRGEPIPTDALDLVVRLQAETWGMPPEELVPVNLLAVLEDSGGSVLVAYRLEAGFNADGWLGFAIAVGGRAGVLVSHMLGVRPEARGGSGIGWHLKLLQGHLALRTGHHAAVWTFDPMRGASARLNLEKLGATVVELTIDKYGRLRSALYGDVPSDRFTARWDLRDPAVAERLRRIAAGAYAGPTLADLADLPEATPATAANLAAARPPRLWYRVPADIDALMAAEPETAIRWRSEMRAVLSRFLTTATARDEDAAALGPIAVGKRVVPGAYAVTGFVSGTGADGRRLNAYLLDRRQNREEPDP